MTVRLRVHVFDRMARAAGFRSDFQVAAAMGVNRSTVKRVKDGKLRPGPAFIGGALTALAPKKFEELFQVVDQERTE
ncbi:transcriptional regulator [Saccharothrix violaceirubra]|uniref:Helix-turn-helix protein n=1 Tax=Saccharothrix violaceirubra TaxID=413306 RepID=A0A7W7T7L4_9PSEU|nr:transcriptional regulator [Saccharothrix violaceirubra]MBB4967811.1 hypothetical protein [Saccharothrix violaceirubra]